MTLITVHGHPFNTGTPDENGVLWKITDLPGWREARRDLAYTPNVGQGVTVGMSVLRERLITLVGSLTAVDNAARANAQDALVDLVSNGLAERELLVHEPTVKVVHYVAGGTPRVRPRGVMVRFELPVLCADPRKYGLIDHQVTPVPYDLPVELPNAGTAHAPLRIQVGGDGADGFVHLQDPDTGVQYSAGPFPAGTVLDGRDLTATTPAGDLVHTFAPGWTWPTVRPTRDGVQRYRSIGPTPLTLIFRDAWN